VESRWKPVDAGLVLMGDHPIRALAIFEDEDAARQERVRAVRDLASWVRLNPSGISEVGGVFEKATSFWRDLCRLAEEPSTQLLRDRIQAARACTTVSLALPGGQRFFRNIPRSWRAEGPYLHRREGRQEDSAFRLANDPRDGCVVLKVRPGHNLRDLPRLSLEGEVEVVGG